MSESLSVTKDDKKVTSSFALRDLALELKNYRVVILNAIEMLKHPADSTQERKDKGAKELEELASFVTATPACINNHLKNLDPVGKKSKRRTGGVKLKINQIIYYLIFGRKAQVRRMTSIYHLHPCVSTEAVVSVVLSRN